MSLKELSIRNFAIIKKLEIELNDGLTVVTGETGAGKSIVLGALNLLLGARAEADMIRHGEDQCEVTALFSVSKLSAVKNWLREHDLISDTESRNYCLVRRILRRNKPTKCYINDQPTTLAALKELGLLLVDLHGQHEHQSLLRVAHQRHIIDQFSGHDDALKALAVLSSRVRRLEKQLSTMSKAENDNADKLELMAFQLNELDEASIQEGEFEELEQEHARLSNAQALTDGIRSSIDQLFESDQSNVSAELGRTIHRLADLASIDTNLQPASDLLNSALAQIEEAKGALESALNKIEQDPNKLVEIEQRRDTLINLARKHRCAENALPERHQLLQAEYSKLESESSEPEKLEREIERLKEKYYVLAHAVSNRRQEVAADLSSQITLQMQDLGMRGGELKINVEPQIDDTVIISEHGIDQIEFMVSTNHGVPLKPLQKTASGGELSRISLAIQVITSEQSDTPTLVFDEVDVGVGGKIAQIVGMRLRNLGQNAQVLCITHQPQVAAQGHQHLLIDKVADKTDTHSTLIPLDGDLRVGELARMLGGSEITERTIAHAREMLDSVA